MTGWMAYYSLEPWGFWGEWARTGRICETMANPWRGKDHAPFKPQDFMPADPAEGLRKQSTAEMKAILEAIAKATGAKIVKRKRS